MMSMQSGSEVRTPIAHRLAMAGVMERRAGGEIDQGETGTERAEQLVTRMRSRQSK